MTAVICNKYTNVDGVWSLDELMNSPKAEVLTRIVFCSDGDVKKCGVWVIPERVPDWLVSGGKALTDYEE